MKSLRILFLPYPVPSHVNAIWGLASILAKQGHVCNFALQDTLPKSLVEQLPGKAFKFNSLSFGVGFEGPLVKSEKSNDKYLDDLIARMTSRIYLDRKAKIQALVTQIGNIDVVMLDTFLFSDFIILYPYLKLNRVKLFFIQTMFPFLHPEGNCPPLTSTTTPETYTWWLKTKHNSRRYLRRLIQKIKYLNFDNQSILFRKIKENNIPKKFSIQSNTTFSPSFTNISELILAPQDIEFPNLGKYDWQYYVGYLPGPKRRELTDSRYPNLVTELITEKNLDAQIKLIYVSLGTLYETYENQVIDFLKKVFSIARKKNNYRFVISLTSKLWPKLETIPPNIFLLELVAQLHLLPQVDLFITHAGLNSIKEAIDAGVPMLCFPLSVDSDQPGNAARVQYHKLGILGDMRRDREEAISQKIVEIISNNIYRQNIANFAKRCRNKYNEEHFVSLFNHLCANYPEWE
ncbi:MAG: glycosyltransferase [Bernardetiaceae bacterium]|jgi:UDP:flavonoid glycosyltransferase YjiC (YdhE family)|nr:glycosyltransferase [Bernardetiaceae bacterium]